MEAAVGGAADGPAARTSALHRADPALTWALAADGGGETPKLNASQPGGAWGPLPALPTAHRGRSGAGAALARPAARPAARQHAELAPIGPRPAHGPVCGTLALNSAWSDSKMDVRTQRQKRVRQDWAGEELGSEASGSSFSGDAAADAYSSDDDSGEQPGGRGRVGL